MFKTIKGTLTIVMSIVVAVAMMLLGTVSVLIAGRSLVGNAEKQLKAESAYYAEQISNWLGNEMTMVEGVSESLKGLAESGLDTVLEEEQMRALLTAFAEGREQLLNLYIGTTKKDFVQSNPDATTPEGYDPTERGWYKLAEERKETVVTDPYMDVLIGGMCVTVATPVYIDNELFAVIGADYTLDTINHIVAAVTTEAGAYGFLVDSAGNYVSHPNEAYMPGEDKAISLAAEMPGISYLAWVPDGNVLLAKDYDGVRKYFVSSQIEACSWIMGVVVPQHIIVGSLNALVVICLLLSVASILVVIVLMSFLIRRQLAPMEEMKRFIQEKLAAGVTETEAKDEVAQIQYLINVLKEQFIGTIRKTQEESVRIEAQMTQAGRQIGEMSGNITAISATMQETGANVQGQTQSIEDISSSCMEISRAVDALSQDSQMMAEKARKMREHVGKVVPALIKSKNNAVRMTKESRRKLEEAIQGAKIIEEIVGVSEAIQSIAEQTSLLALNASIEAARAGEAGRGFAVVASEISGLSQNTTEEIDKVGQLTQKVLENVEELSRESQEILGFIDTSILRDYEDVEKLAGDYDRDTGYYAKMSEGIGASAQQLAASMQEITSTVAEVEDAQKELNAAVSSINDNLQEIAYAGEGVQSGTDEVMASISSLKSKVNSFAV